MKKINVISYFDGISCGQQALTKAGISYDKYYAAEIHEPSIKVTQKRFPKTIQIGDVRSQTAKDFKDIHLALGGSPCQGFSMSGKRKGMVTTENIKVDTLEKYLQLKKDGFQFDGQSYLFWEFVRMVKEARPRYFFLENVKMNKEWENIITKTMGVKPHIINSSKVSGQNRLRYYWTNIPMFNEIQDKGIMFDHIIPGAVAAGTRGRQLNGEVHPNGKPKYTPCITKRDDGKANCVTTQPGTSCRYYDKDGNYKRITPEQAEVLQTIQEGYTNIEGISKTQRLKMVGNAWTVDVIVEFLSNLK